MKYIFFRLLLNPYLWVQLIIISFFVSLFWLPVLSKIGILSFVDTIGAFSRGPERAATVALIIESESSTVQEDLDPDARILIDTLAEVQDSLRWKGGSDVLLPAEFYQALSRKDVAGEVRFEVTDEQLLSGIHLYRGSIVEMYSGEGKTIAAAFPGVMHAVEGRAVHIVTANDYLAFRDSQLLAPVYKSLGVSVDAVMNYMIDEERREAYANGSVRSARSNNVDESDGVDGWRDVIREPWPVFRVASAAYLSATFCPFFCSLH